MKPSLYWRTALIVAALAAAFLIVREGLARVSSRSPALLAAAARIAPEDAQVNILLAAGRLSDLGKNPDAAANNPAALQQAGREAARALAYDITKAEALAIYGLAVEARLGRQAAQGVMQASQSLSSRDLVTRLWLIRDAARRQQLGEMLPHIDIAMRTSVGARDILFPLLAQALVDPALVPDFIRMLKPDADWVEPFLYTAITTNRGTRNLARIYLALGKPYRYGGEDLSELIMETLVAQRDYASAFAFNQGLTGKAAGTGIEDPGFVRHQGFEPFTWRLTQTAEFDAARSTDSFGKPGLAVTSTGSKEDVAAAQLLALPPGRYRFANKISSDMPEIRLVPQWRLRCANDQRAIGTLLPRSQTQAEWSVPDNCPYQWLELNVDASATMTAENIMIGPVTLQPIGPAKTQLTGRANDATRAAAAP